MGDTIRKARLGEEGWNDLKHLLRALNDTRVKSIGQDVLSAVRRNALFGPAEIGEQIKVQLQGPKLMALTHELYPKHLREALLRRWGHQRNIDGKEVWRMLLDPTGEVFQKIRSNQSLATQGSKIIPSSAIALPSSSMTRLLRGGTWEKPELNGLELAEGITSIVFISAAELLLHLDLLIPQMKLPTWVHSIFFVPAYGLGASSCYIGLSFWCEFFLGALGLNALDAAIVMSGVIPKSYLTGEASEEYPGEAYE